MTTLRVLIIADDHFARGGLAALLGAEDGINIVASQESSANLAEAPTTYRPDVVLWDMGWETAESLEKLRSFIDGTLAEEGPEAPERSRSPEPQAPVLALVAEPDDAAAARDAGALGILLRDASPRTLVQALNAVAADLFVADPEFTSHLFTASALPVEPLVEPLTPREHEILQLIAEGLANKAIARQLNISDHTVKFHTTAIFGKLGVSSRTEAVVRATRAGLILL